MNREEIEKLLGGYATDTLTDAERRTLFEAALSDQELFDKLAREQALRDLLQDPEARQYLLEALSEPARAEAPRARWWFWQPSKLALAGSLAAGLIVVAVVLERPAPAPPALQVAKALPPRVQEETVPGAPPPSAEVPRPAVVPRPMAVAPRTSAVPPPMTAPATVPSAPAGPQREAVVVSGAIPQAPSPQDSAAPAPSRALTTGAVAGFVAVPNAELAGAARFRPQRLQYRILVGESLAEPGREYHTGEALRLSLTPEESGYLYVLERAAAGNWQSRFSGKVDAGKTVLVPAEGPLLYTERGRKVWKALLSRQPDPTLENPAPERMAALARTAGGRIANLRVKAATGREGYGPGGESEPAAAEISAVEISFDVR